MKKEKRKISLSTYIITLLIMLVIIIALICVIIGERNKNVVTSGAASNTENQNTTIVEEEPKLIANTNYVEIAIEDTESTEGLAYTKSVKIDDEKIIERLENIVNNGTEFTVESTEGPDIPPVVTFYLENGEEYEVATNDKEGDNEIFISKYNGDSNEFEWKKTYKIDIALGEYITELYNQYKDTNTIDDSQEGLQKVLENYLKTEVVKEEGESYTINEMNQKGRRIYEVTYDYYVGEAEPTQGTLTVTFKKDGAGNYIVGNCEF